MDWIEPARLIIDFGLVVLIWLVQIIIYPSFEFVESSQFRKWHERYTNRISFFVGPLMLSQVALWLTAAYQFNDWLSYFALACIGIVWLSTIGLSVPCHNAHAGSDSPNLCDRRSFEAVAL